MVDLLPRTVSVRKYSTLHALRKLRSPQAFSEQSRRAASMRQRRNTVLWSGSSARSEPKKVECGAQPFHADTSLCHITQVNHTSKKGDRAQADQDPIFGQNGRTCDKKKRRI
jgi:hypothetical protein